MAVRSQAQQISNDVLQRAHARLTSAAERYDLGLGVAAFGDCFSAERLDALPLAVRNDQPALRFCHRYARERHQRLIRFNVVTQTYVS